MTVKTLPDIVGPANWAPFVAKGTNGYPAGSAPRARRLWLCATGGNGASFGDSSTAAAQGTHLPNNTPRDFSASDADPTDSIDLSTVGVFVPGGVTVTVTYGF